MPATVDILLSVYNGESFLQQQLDSIAGQSYSDWRLILRDDGSSDKSREIIEQFKNNHPEKIEIVKDTKGNIGYNASFMELMGHATSDYIMLCDHDDFWYPEKISVLLAAIKDEEKKHNTKGILAFCDLQLTDEKLNITHDSFLRKMRFNANNGNQVFFLKNYVPGCSTMFNKALLQEAFKTQNLMGFHDQWLITLAAAINGIVCVNKPLMKYRQHDKNAIGIKADLAQTLGLFIKDALKYAFQNKKYRQLMYSKNIAQLQNICSVLPGAVSKEASDFVAIDRSAYISRKLKNISKPYLIGRSFLEQLTYIICF